MGCINSKETPLAPPDTHSDTATVKPNDVTSASAAATMEPVSAAVLSSYAVDCRIDPDIQSFDETMRRRTKEAMSNLAASGGVDLRELSLSSMMHITSFLRDTNEGVVNYILQCREGIWKNPELFAVVDEYFQTSLQTLEFCRSLENCLNRARNSQLNVQMALQCFQEEKDASDSEGKKNYHRTLEELRKFKEAGDPFTEEFFQAFQLVLQKQVTLLNKLQMQKKKLDKKLKNVEAWRKVSSIIFVSTFAAVLICSVIAAALTAPAVIVALTAAASVPMGSIGKWIDSLWKGYVNALKEQKEIIGTMEWRTYFAIIELTNIHAVVNQLEIKIDSLLQTAEFSIKRKEAVPFSLEDMKKKLADFVKNIEDLKEEVNKCSQDIHMARTAVLQKIINHSR